MPKSVKQTVAPTMTPERAIDLLSRYIAEADGIKQMRSHDGRVDAWEAKCIDVMDAVFGRPDGEDDPKTYKFRFMHRGPMYVDMPQIQIENNHVASTSAREQLLVGYVELLRDRVPPPVMAAGTYKFHPAIEAVADGLFRSGHYRQAVLDAQICVINALQTKSGVSELDGSKLIDRVLTIRKNEGTPIVQMNAFSNQAERDEQQGFHFLFKGLAMLRNFKAHTTIQLDSPERAIEYLSLCSLLHRMIDNATVNA